MVLSSTSSSALAPSGRKELPAWLRLGSSLLSLVDGSPALLLLYCAPAGCLSSRRPANSRAAAMQLSRNTPATEPITMPAMAPPLRPLEPPPPLLPMTTSPAPEDDDEEEKAVTGVVAVDDCVTTAAAVDNKEEVMNGGRVTATGIDEDEEEEEG